MRCVSCGHEPRDAGIFYLSRAGFVCGPCYVLLLSGAEGSEDAQPRPLAQLWSTTPILWRR